MPQKTAQKKAKLKFDINLLPGRDFEKSQIGRFLSWALSVGRYIVIFTELIVILAFLARFKLDRDISDLHEEIDQKKVIVNSAEGLEKDYKTLQYKISQIKELEEKQKDYRELLARLGVMTPIDAVIEGVSINGPNFNLKAVVFSDAGLATFINEFRSSEIFSSVLLGTITKGEEGVAGTKFSITAQITGKITKLEGK